jgi:hypothetical protein
VVTSTGGSVSLVGSAGAVTVGVAKPQAKLISKRTLTMTIHFIFIDASNQLISKAGANCSRQVHYQKDNDLEF